MVIAMNNNGYQEKLEKFLLSGNLNNASLVKAAIAEANKRPDNPKSKSIAYSFLLVFGKAKDKKWQYSQIEVEYGEFLKKQVKKLLDSDPKSYHKNLQELLTVSGSSESIDNNLI